MGIYNGDPNAPVNFHDQMTIRLQRESDMRSASASSPAGQKNSAVLASLRAQVDRAHARQAAHADVQAHASDVPGKGGGGHGGNPNHDEHGRFA